MSKKPSVAIIGAGISGLTAALGCFRAGLKATVYDSPRTLAHYQTGIVLWRDALYALHKLLGKEKYQQILSKGEEAKVGGLRNWKGAYFSSMDSMLKKQGVSDIPIALAIERNDLVETIASELPADFVCTGEEFLTFSEKDDAVRAMFASGLEVDADVLIGADGINSRVRNVAFPEEKPIYTGNTAWSGISPYENDEILPRGYIGESWGNGKQVGLIRLPGNRVYWYLITSGEESISKESYEDELKSELAETFGHFHEPIQEIIQESDVKKIYQSDVHILKPLKKYTSASGRVVLMGDAAHCPTPSLGLGGCLSIEDACQFAQSMHAHQGNVAVASEEYNKMRQERNTDVHNSLENVSQMASMEKMSGLRDKLMSFLPNSVKQNHLTKIISYEVKMDFVTPAQKQ